MSRERRRRGSSRRTPVPVTAGGRELPMIPILVVVGALAVATLIGFLIWQTGKEPGDRFGSDTAIERDPAPDKAGEHVDLPEIYSDERGQASYGSDGSVPNTAPHVTGTVDYADQGQPPTGGPHWSGACTDSPSTSPAVCGPVPWGIYREAWEGASLIHNMEHGGTIIWYNTTDQDVIDDLEEFVGNNRDKLLVLTPYPQMAEEHVAITVWSRRGLIPASEYSREFIEDFMDDWYCKFDPEGFC